MTRNRSIVSTVIFGNVRFLKFSRLCQGSQTCVLMSSEVRGVASAPSRHSLLWPLAGASLQSERPAGWCLGERGQGVPDHGPDLQRGDPGPMWGMSGGDPAGPWHVRTHWWGRLPGHPEGTLLSLCWAASSRSPGDEAQTVAGGPAAQDGPREPCSPDPVWRAWCRDPRATRGLS